MNDRTTTPLTRGNWHSGARFWLMIALCGLAWGAVEATFGWMLHTLHFHGIRALLFPVGLTCMSVAIYRTGRAWSVAGVAVVAAAVKLCDLFLGAHFRGVVSPAVNILIDGALVALFFRVCACCDRRNVVREYAVAFGAMFSAMVLFALWREGLNAATGADAAMFTLWEPERLVPQLLQVLLRALYLVVAWSVIEFVHYWRVSTQKNKY